MKKLIKRIMIKMKYYNKNVKLHKNVSVAYRTIFEGYNIIGKNSTIDGEMGFGSYIDGNSNISGGIGKFCSIASNVNVITGTHPSSLFVSTYPSFYSTIHTDKPKFIDNQKFNEFVYANKEKKYSVIIGNDVWVGSYVTIMPGITIGDGAIVGAGAIVTKDVPPYAIVGGIPAKVIKYRFDEEQIEKLLQIKWWDKPIDWIKENADNFDNIDEFLKRYI